MEKHLKLQAIMILLSITGCTSMKYTVELSSVQDQSSKRLSQSEYEEFRFSVFPKEISQKLAKIEDKKGGKTLRSLCNKRKPKLLGHASPKMDLSALKSNYAFDYLKKHFFFEASNPIQAESGLTSLKTNYSEVDKYYPLLMARSEDLSVLREQFVFALPKKVICSFAQQENQWTPEQARNCAFRRDFLAPFGYNAFNGEYSPAQALKQKDFLWQWVLEKSTHVTENKEKDKLELNLDLTLFCSYSIAIADLTGE